MTSVAPRTRTRLKLRHRHTRVLYIVAKLHYVSVQDIGLALCYAPTSYEWVRKTVHQLWRHRYLARQVVPREERAGSSPYAYRLDGNGYAVLKAHQKPLGLSLPTRFRDRPVSPLLLAHDFAVNAFLIAGMQLAHRTPELFISRFEHDRSLRRKIRVTLADGKLVTLNTDGYLEFIYRSRWQIPLLFECDRNHHEIERWKEKIQKLVAYIRSNQHEQLFGTRGLTIPCFVDGDAPERVNQLLEWTKQELEELGARDTAKHFLFASFRPAVETPEQTFEAPVWRQPFEPEPVPLVTTPEASRPLGSEVMHAA